MKPIAPLMIEHRVIERMLGLVDRERRKLSRTGTVDRAFLGIALEFFRTYVDRFHHGKEEDVLFREMQRKALAAEHRTLLQELLDEHRNSRPIVDRLVRTVARERLSPGDVRLIAEDLEWMLTSYPAHIEKEDKRFFPAAMRYLTEQEQAAMLEAMQEFDRGFTQQRYADVIRELEEREAA